MIAHVVQPYGWRPAGLIAYLFGPGRHEEHRDPRVVASWDGAPGFHQPPKLPAVRVGDEVIEPGEFDFDLRPLNATMEEWPRRAKLPVTTPPPIPAAPADPAGQREVEYWSEWLRASGKRKPPREAPEWVRWHRYDPKAQRIVLRPGYVWHCPVRLAPDDPTLTDAQWEMIAQRLMMATGLQQEGCRWIAVRHADDHIHLVATLVSERTGRRVYPRNDFAKLREACQQLEKELGLTRTPDIDWTAARNPTRREVGKAERIGRREPARVELRRVVSQAAAAAHDGGEFLRLLQQEGLVVRVQRTSDGQIRGYAVGLPTDVTAEGRPVLYSGSKLARDLTWPKLLERWASTPTHEPVPLPRTETGHPTPAARRAVLAEAAEVVNRAAATLHAGHEDGDGIAHAAGEVLATLSAAKEGREPGELSAVLDTFDRAARTPERVLPGDVGAVGSRAAVGRPPPRPRRCPVRARAREVRHRGVARCAGVPDRRDRCVAPVARARPPSRRRTPCREAIPTDTGRTADPDSVSARNPSRPGREQCMRPRLLTTTGSRPHLHRHRIDVDHADGLVVTGGGPPRPPGGLVGMRYGPPWCPGPVRFSVR